MAPRNRPPFFRRKPKPFKSQEVWMVQHDESPDDTIVGVFATQGEAADFARIVSDNYEDGVLYTSYEIGYRSTDNPPVRYWSID